MKVGIIGHMGFVGAAFFKAFSEGKGHSVTGIDRQNYATLRGTRFDILVNCNGNSSKRLAESDPAEDFDANASATVRALLDFPCEHYVHISTVEVYNDKTGQEATREDVRIDPSGLSNYGFSKYCGELAAMKYAKSCMVLRLAGMVGPGMKKGPAYDILAQGRLFISSKSELHFMHTRDVARIAMLLCSKGKWGETYNVVGRGTLPLSEFASIAGTGLSGEGDDVVKFSISTAKLQGVCPVPESKEAVKKFVGEWGR